MKISAFRSSHPVLFPMGADKVFRTMAQTRNYVGDFFEAATAAASGALRMKTDGTADICPDLQFNESTWFESKAIGKTGAAIIYTHRAENDARFVATTGGRLLYWLWNHHTPAGEMRSLYELRASLAASVRSLSILDFAHLRTIIERYPQKILNNKKKTPAGARLGYGAEKYKLGWNVRLSAFHAELPCAYRDAVFDVYGLRVRVPVIMAADQITFDVFHSQRLF